MLGLAASLQRGGASLLTFVKDNLKLYLDFKSNKSDTLKFPSEGSTSFDGVDDRIDCGQIDVSGQGITFSAWIYRDGTTDDAVVGRWNSNGAMLYAGGANIMLYINGNNTFTSTPDKTWFHIAGTFDGVNRKIYKNGVLEDTDADTGTIVNPSENFEIGNAEFSSGKDFKGKLANVAMWSRALTQEEVQSIMNKSYSQLKGVEKTSLVSWWALDSAQVNTTESDHTGLFTLASNTTNSSVSVSNGEFELGDTTDWSTSASKSFTVTNGIARSVANGTTTLAVNKSVTGLTAGKVYKFEIKHYSDGGNTNMAYMSGVTGNIDIPSSLSITTFYHVAPATSFSLNWYAHGASEDQFIEIHYLRVEEVPMAGKVTGATTTTSVYGGNAPILPRAVDVAKEGQADAIGNGSAYFGGHPTDDHVVTPKMSINFNSFSISLWAKPINFTSDDAFICIADTDSNDEELLLYNRAAGNHQFSAFLPDPNTEYNSTYEIPEGEWSHLAFTKSGNTLKLYANGIEVHSGSCVNNNTYSRNIFIGARKQSSIVLDMNTYISQVGIWQGALTQAQIQSVMESTSYSKIPADVKSTLGSNTFGGLNEWVPKVVDRESVSVSGDELTLTIPSANDGGMNTGNLANLGLSTSLGYAVGDLAKLEFQAKSVSVESNNGLTLRVVDLNGYVFSATNISLTSEYQTFTIYGKITNLGYTIPSILRMGNQTGTDVYKFKNFSVQKVTNDLVAYYGLDSTVSTEKITNGDFSAWTNDNPDGWTIATDLSGGVESNDVKITEDANGARIYSTGTNIHMTQNVMTIGATYEVTIVVHSVTTGDITTQNLSSNLSINSAGTHTVTTTATATGFRIKRNFPVDMVISSVSVKEVQTPDSLGNNNGVLL